jgi:hypothetical protein
MHFWGFINKGEMSINHITSLGSLSKYELIMFIINQMNGFGYYM